MHHIVFSYIRLVLYVSRGYGHDANQTIQYTTLCNSPKGYD